MASSNAIGALERAVSNQIATFSQDSQAIHPILPPIKVNAMNMQFPVFSDMTHYNPNGTTGIGGDHVQVLKPSAEYKPAAVFQTYKEIEIPIGTKRELSVLDDPEGKQLVNLIARMVTDSKLVTLEYNMHSAVLGQTYNTNNTFSAGNINIEKSGEEFREAVNNGIGYLKSKLNGLNSGHKIVIAMPESAWYRLTASQKLINYFNGYAEKNANYNLQTISAIFSENAGINVEVKVGGLRYLDAKFATGDSELIWNDNDAFYMFVTTSDMFASRASIKRLEGIERMAMENKGLKTCIDFYTDYGYFIDVPDAFVKIPFTTA